MSPKIINIFWQRFKILIYFTTKCQYAHIWKFIQIQQWLKHKLWYVEATINIFNNKLQRNIHSKNSFLREKMIKKILTFLLFKNIVVHLIMIAPKHYWFRMKLPSCNFNITLTYWQKVFLKFCNEDFFFFLFFCFFLFVFFFFTIVRS
jgi:hypothetical protein